MRNRLGNPEPLFPEDTALSERAQLGMAPAQPGTGTHSRQEECPEALATPCSVEERHRLPKAVDRPPIVALGLVGEAEVLFASACRTTSPLAMASARTREPAAMAWSYAPMPNTN